jgi:hypothetical protein
MLRKPKVIVYGSLIVVLLLSLLLAVRNLTSVHASTTITISSQNALTAPWLGLGAQYGNIETSLTDGQWNALFARVNYMQPGVVRSTDNFGMCTSPGCPSYDWNAPSMQAWYRMLDGLKDSGTIVMIGAWRVPDGVDFASPQWAQIQADFLQHMIFTKGYTNILYYHTPNEADCNYPGQDWTDKTIGQWETATNNLYNALSSSSLLGKVAIAGPDACGDGWNSQAPIDEQSHLGLYEWHHYDGNVSNGNDETYLRSQVQTIDSSSHLPVFLGEIGAGNADDVNVTSAYQYGLDMADYGIQIARAGLSGASAWCLDDNLFPPKGCGVGDVKTGTVKPWFYSWGLLTRYLRPGSILYAPSVSTADLRVVAAQSSAAVDGTLDWTLAFVNQNSSDEAVAVNIAGLGTGGLSFKQYNYVGGQLSVDSNGFPTPAGTLQATLGSDIDVTVPAKSMVLLTTLATSGPLSSILNIVGTPGSSNVVSRPISVPTPTPSTIAPVASPAPTSTLIGVPTPTPTIATAPGSLDTGGLNEQTIIDNLDDWSKVAAHTSALTFDKIHNSWFENDPSRVKRWGNIPQNFVYRYQNLVDFTARVYLSDPHTVSSFSVDTSPDGKNWTSLALGYTPIAQVFNKTSDTTGETNISNIYATTYSPLDTIPPGTQFIRINLANDPLMWTPQVGQVSLTVGQPGNTGH